RLDLATHQQRAQLLERRALRDRRLAIEPRLRLVRVARRFEEHLRQRIAVDAALARRFAQEPPERSLGSAHRAPASARLPGARRIDALAVADPLQARLVTQALRD